MKSPLPHWLWIANWPIWFKLLFGFLLATLIPTLLIFNSFQREIRALDRENLAAYIRSEGTERAERLSEIFNQAGVNLAAFATNSAYQDGFLRILTGGLLRQELQDYIDTRLVGSGLFSGVRLLNPEGQVLLSERRLTPEGEVTYRVPLMSDQTTTPAFQAALSTAALQINQELFLGTQDNAPVIEIIHVIYRENVPFGFLIGTVNHENVLTAALIDRQAFIDNYSYVVGGNRQVIAPSVNMAQARVSAQANPLLTLAPNPESASQNSAAYTINGVEYLGYYVPIAGTPFELMTEVAANTPFGFDVGNVYRRWGLLGMAMIVMGAAIGLIVNLLIVVPLRSLQADMQNLFQGDFDRPIETARRVDEIGALARTFADIRERVRSMVAGLEAEASARNRDIQATQEVSRFAVSQRELQTLMDNVVDLIVERFPNIYHAQIFLISPDGVYAVLRASTGAAGRQLLDLGHRLAVGSVSVVGRATEEGRVVVAGDTEDSDVHRRNKHLPDTRAELAIPLRIGDSIIGVLDVQSTERNTFTKSQISTLQTMTDQIAIAIENARLYAESIRRLELISKENQETMLRAWKDYLRQRRQPALNREAGAPALSPLEEQLSLRQRALFHNKPAIGGLTSRDTVPFAVPIRLREQTLGTVEWELTAADFSSEKVQLAQELVNHLAVSLDNARLIQENRRAIEREQLVNDIAAKLTQHNNMDDILQTAVRELGQALRVPQVSLQIKLSDEQALGRPIEADPPREKGAQTHDSLPAHQNNPT